MYQFKNWKLICEEKDREITRLKEELERVKRVERLTTKVWDAMQKAHSYVEKSHNIELNTGGDDFEEIIEKLGQYEDLEEQGLLLKLQKDGEQNEQSS